MQLLIITLLVATAAARECLVSEWDEWSQCRYPQTNPGHSTQDHAELVGEGTMYRLEGMAMKQQRWDEWDQCVDNGLCPSMPSVKGAIPCTGGASGGYPCRNIEMLSHLTQAQIGLGVGNDIWGWTDPQTNEEYAIMGNNLGTAFIRVTNPENPVIVGTLLTQTSGSSWRDIKVVNDHAYIVSEAGAHGMQVFDLTRFRTAEYNGEPMMPDSHYGMVGNSHNIVMNQATQRVFIVGATALDFQYDSCLGGLHVIDVSNPKNPQQVGCYWQDGYVHDAECVIYNGPDVFFQGREICFCYNENSFTIVDVTGNNEDDWFEISRSTYTGSRYTHQGWLTNDMTIALLDDEQDEQRNGHNTRTYIWNIRDLTNPINVNNYDSTEPAIDHNQYVLGDYTYQSNYEAGLRVLYIDQPNYNLIEGGYFDCHPSRTAAQFTGTWSNYPYYTQGAQGTVALSSIDNGFFMLRPNLAQMEADRLSLNNKTGLQSRTRRILRSDKGQNCPTLEEVRQC